MMINTSECILAGQPRYASVLPLPDMWGPWHKDRHGDLLVVSVPSSATAVVSPGRATRQFSAQHLPLAAWAQPEWPCGSMGRNFWPPCPSSTALTPSFQPLSQAAAMSECVGSLLLAGKQPWPPHRPSWAG